MRQNRIKKSDARAGASAAVQESVAAEIGAELRSARERLSWRIPDLTAMLRIRSDYLEALEQGRIADLPGRTYAIGFLRTYAEALGLGQDELVHRFKSDTREHRKTELEFPAPVPERGVPVGAVALLGVLLVVGAYAGWYRLSGEGRLPAEAVPPVPERLAPLTEQADPRPRPGASAPGQASSDPQLASPAPVAPPMPPSSAAAAVPGSPTPEEAASPPAAPPQTAEASRIVLRARTDAWMQVRDRTGQVLLNRILRVGESWPVPAGADLLLTTGNAGGTELIVDGAVAPSIGTAGVVRRDLPLDPIAIKDGKLPAQVQTATQNPRNAAVQ